MFRRQRSILDPPLVSQRLVTLLDDDGVPVRQTYGMFKGTELLEPLRFRDMPECTVESVHVAGHGVCSLHARVYLTAGNEFHLDLNLAITFD